MAKHARYSPSKLDALQKCVRFKHIPMEDAATEGTDLHTAFETGSLTGLTPEQSDVVQQALDYVGSLMAGLGLDAIEIREGNCELKDLTYGQYDRLLLSANRKIAHVVDFKGIRVESDHGFQVRTYAAATLEADPRIETVTTHVLAPRLGQATDVATYGRELIASVRAEIAALYAEIDDPWRPPTPHEDICGRCANAAGCPAMGVTAMTVAKAIGLPAPSEFAPDKITSEYDRLVAQVIAVALLNWADQIKKNNTAYVAESGGEVPGFKLITSSTGLRIPKESTGEAVMVLKERMSLSEDELWSAASLSPGRLADLLTETRGGLKADYKQQIQDVLGDIAHEGTKRYLQKVKRKVSDADLIQCGGNIELLGE